MIIEFAIEVSTIIIFLKAVGRIVKVNVKIEVLINGITFKNKIKSKFLSLLHGIVLKIIKQQLLNYF